MYLSYLKLLAFCIAVLALVSCGTASKSTEYVNPQSLEVAAMVGDADIGDRISIPANSGLGMNSVVVDLSYIAASGRQCRRLRSDDGTLIQRVACMGSDGVWSMARDLRPISSIDPAVSDTNVVRNADRLHQPLVPSEGSLRLLNDEVSHSSDTTTPESAQALMTSAAQSLIQADAQRSQISHVEAPELAGAEPVFIVPVDYATPGGVEPADVSLADSSIQTGSAALISSADDYANGDVYVVEQYSAPAAALPAQYNDAQASMLARAESLIISREEYARQTGAELLGVGNAEVSSQTTLEFASPADSEFETVARTVNINETLWSFAKRTTGNALNWETIARVNGISDAKTLAAGTQLLIPVELVGRGD